MNDLTRIIIVEDQTSDYELAKREIGKVLQTCLFQRAETRTEYLQALKSFEPDLIISDYALPNFDGMQALELAKENVPLTPFIILTGSISEDIAVECIKAGATNYVLKENIKRLTPAVVHALEERRLLVERQQAENDLRVSEARFRTFVNHASDAFFLHNEKGIILDVNQQACESLGYSREELIGMTPFDFDATIVPDFMEKIGRHLRREGTFTFETLHRRKDGTTFPVEVRIRSFEEGGLYFGISIVRDITERKRVKEQIQAILENSPIGIFQSTPQGRFLSVNPALAHIYGYDSPQDMIDSITDISRQIYPEPEERKEFKESLAAHDVVRKFEKRNLRKDGSIIWTSTSARAVRDETGNILYYEGFLEDITNRKESEARLRESEERYHGIFESALDAIFVENFEGDILEVNQRACEIFGYTREEFLSKKVIDIVPSEDYIVQFPTDQPLPGRNIETINVRANGEHFPVELSGGLYKFGDRNLYIIILRDISEHKQAEHKLREQEKRFRALIENGTDNISLLAADGTLLWENPAVNSTLGYQQDEFVSRNIFELMHPEDLAWSSTLFNQLVQEPGSQRHGTFRLKHHNGEWRWMEATATNMLDEPSVQAVVINYRDVSERKTAEDELRESQAKYRNLVETSHDLIWAVDAQGRITFLNRAAKDIYGYEPEELIGRFYFDLLDPEHHSTNPENFKEMIGSLNEYQGNEVYIRHRDGRQIVLSANSIVLHDENGNMTGVTGSSRDITRRKQVEEALRDERNLLRTLIDNVPDRIYAMDVQGRRTLSNVADWKASAAKNMEGVIGKTDFDLYPPELAGPFWQLDKAILETGVPVINHEEPGLDFEGNSVSVLTTKIPLRNDEGKIIGLVGIGRDITERKQAEARLQTSEARYRFATQATKDVIWEWNTDTNQLIWSENAQAVFGYSPEEIGPEAIWWDEHIHPEDRDRVVAKLKTLDITGESTWSDEYRFLLKDGSYAYVNDRAYIEHDASGKSVRMIGAMSNITERREAEKRINDLLTFNEKILNHSPLGILTYKATGECVFANEKAASIVGATIQDLLAQNFHTIEVWKTSGLYSLVQQAISTQTMVESDIHVINSFGKDIWMVVHCVTFWSKEAQHVLLSIAEITERKLAEEKLLRSQQELTEAQRVAKLGSWSFDPVKNEIHWSEELYQIFGVEQKEFAHTYDAFMELIHPDDRSEVESKNKAALEKRQSFDIEYRIVTPQGDVKYISEIGYAVTNNEETVSSLFGTSQDITQRKRTEIERQILLEIMQGATSTNDLPEMLQLMHSSIAKVIYAENFFVMLYQPESGTFEEIYFVDQYDDVPTPPVKLEKSLTSYIFHSGEPLLLTPSIFNELVEQDKVELVGMEFKSWLGVPLKTSGRTIGVMAVQDYENLDRYTEHDRDFLTSIASQVALAVASKQASIELQQKNEDLTLLKEINEAVVRGQNLDSIVESMAKELKRIFATLGSTIYMFSPDKRSLTMQEYSFSPEIAQKIEKLLGFTIPKIEIPIKEGDYFHKVLMTRKSAITSEPQEIKDWITGFVETKFLPRGMKPIVRKMIPYIQKLLNIRSMIIVPLISEEEVIGFLDISSTKLFTVNDLKRVERIAEQLTIVFQQQQATEKIRESEERFRLLFENSGEAILITQADGTIASANPEACRIFGRNENEIKNLGRAGVVDISDPRLATAIEERNRTGQFKGELSLLRNDGSAFPAEVSTTLFKDSSGDQKISMIIRDITERKRAENAEREQRVLAEALRDTSQILSSTLDYGEVLDHILAAVGRVVPHDAATITIIEGEFAQVVRSQGYNKRNSNDQIMGVKLSLAKTTNLQEMLKTKQPVVVYDTHTYPGWQRMESTEWLRSNVGAPISMYGEVIGFVLLDSETPNFFTQVHAERLQAFANQAAVAMHNADILQQAREEIAQRKRVEEELRQSEKRYRTVVENQTEFIVRWKPDGIRTFANDAYCRYYAITVEEALSTGFMPLIHEEDRPSVQEKLSRLLSGETRVETSTHRVYKPDGSIGWNEWTEHAIYDENGQLIEFQSVGRDITERKRAEEELRISEERFRQLADNIEEVFWMTDAQTGKEIYISPAGEKIWGHNLDYLLNEPDAFIEIILPEDKPHVVQALESEKHGEKVDMEYRIQGHDGSIHWIWDRAFPIFDENGNVKILAGIAADITKRKLDEMAAVQSQARYYALFESSPISLWEEDYSLVKKRIEELQENGVTNLQEYFSAHPNMVLELASLVKVIDVNQASVELYHAKRKENLLQNLLDFVSEETLLHFQEEVIGLMSPEARFTWEGKDKTIDGKDLMVVINGSIAPGYEENWSKIIVSISDITERKRAEDSLRAEQKKAQNYLNIAGVIMLVLDQDGVVSLINQKGCEILGYSSEEIIGKNWIQTFLPLEEQEALKQVFEQLSTGDTLPVAYYENPILTRSGERRLVAWHNTAVRNNDGQVIGTLSSGEDITERKQTEEALRESEERFSSAFEFAPIGIALVSLDGHFLKVNHSLCDFLGYEDRELITKTFQEITHPEDLETDLNYVAQMLSGQAVSYQMEKRYTHKSGTNVWALLSVSLVKDGEGKPQYFISQIEDITERKQAEEEIHRRAQETAALLETSLTLTNLDLKVILESIGRSAQNLFAADGCRIFLMQSDGETLRCVLVLQENASAFTDLRIKIGQGVTGVVAASGQAEIVNQMQNDPRAMQVVGTQEEEEEAIMFAPLRERDRTIGVLSIRRGGTERPFHPDDLELLEAFASMAASAVSNARLFEEARRRLSEFEALYENGLAVGQLLESTEIGSRIIETFARYLSWHHVAIRLLRSGTDELEVIAFNQPGLSDAEKLEMERHYNQMVSKTEQGLSGWVVKTGRPLRTGNVHEHPQYVDTQAGIKSGLYMPLKIGDRVIGVISVESETPDAFTEQDERLLATLGNQAAIAFENARLYQAAQQEILERTRAQAALWASETHYRELADSITDVLFELDHELRFTHWNKASEMLTGVPQDDAIGRSMFEIFGDSDEQFNIGKIYENVLTKRQAGSFETEFMVRGQKLAFEINAYPSTRGISVVARDATERKLSETLMQKRFELMEYAARHTLEELMRKIIDEVSALTDSHIGFLHFVEENQTGVVLQTWSSETLQVMAKIEEQGMHYPVELAGVWADAIRQRQALIHNDYESLPHKKGMPEGHVKVIRELVIPIIRNDTVVAVLGIGNKPQDYTQQDLESVARFADYAWDITERKQMEKALADERNQLARHVEERTAELSRANSNLARALHVKDEFLANMSHELRTPLNAILGLSESLGEQIAGPLNEKQQKYLSTINESGHHLLSLINDILDLAKIEAGQITLDINKVDVNSVCQASLRMIKQLSQRKNQEVLFEIDENVGLMWADERRLKQMIVNLLSNAVKFTPDSGSLGLEVHGDKAGNKVIITVWDHGIGIGEQDIDRLFKPFIQLDAGLAREASGTGLGLALVAQMARLHGGSVSVSSKVGIGSQFSIQLPWEPALAPDTAARLRSTGKFQAIDPNKKRPTILLIEDTREVVMMLVDYLEMAGYNMATAQDGIDGLTQAKLFHPDLILMDIQMPRMDGFETTKRLRNDPEFKDTPIIALTALAMPNDRERCLAAGMDEYLSKPVNLRALAKLIKKILFENKEATSL